MVLTEPLAAQCWQDKGACDGQGSSDSSHHPGVGCGHGAGLQVLWGPY